MHGVTFQITASFNTGIGYIYLPYI